MDARSFPTHSLIEPVQTLEQARAVLASLPAWSAIGFRELRKRREGAHWKERLTTWEKDRLAIIPGLAQADERELDPHKLVQFRHAESVALVIEAEKSRWKEFPELGLSALSCLQGFRVSYHNNGPDSPPTMSLHSAVFSAPSMQDPGVGDFDQQREEQTKAFSRLRDAWDPVLPESPLHGILNMLANQDPQYWQADISTAQSTFESLLGPALHAEFVSGQMDHALPKMTEAFGAGPSRVRF